MESIKKTNQLKSEIQKLNEEVTKYMNDIEALKVLIALTEYTTDFENGKIDNPFIGRGLFQQFIKTFSTTQRNVSYKNIDIKKEIAKILKRLMSIRKRYNNLIKKTENISLPTDILDELKKLDNRMLNFKLEDAFPQYLTEILQKKQEKKISNIFLQAIEHCTYCYDSWLESFGKEPESAELQTELLKDVIEYYESSQNSVDKLESILLMLFKRNLNPLEYRELIKNNFKMHETDFQNLLMYSSKRYELIDILLKFDLINPESLIETNEQDEKYSILSCCLEEWNDDTDFLSFNRIYDNLNIPVDIRENDDMEILKRMSIENIPYFIRNKKFVLTDEKFDIIIRKIRKELLKPAEEQLYTYQPFEQPFTYLCWALKDYEYTQQETDKNFGCGKYIGEIVNECHPSTIETRKKLIDRLTLLLKEASNRANEENRENILSRVKNKSE